MSAQDRRHPFVAQIGNLLYRRMAFGGAYPAAQPFLDGSLTTQVANLRYGRMAFCATGSQPTGSLDCRFFGNRSSSILRDEDEDDYD